MLSPRSYGRREPKDYTGKRKDWKNKETEVKMASKERELLEEIANGTMSWGPSDTSIAAHEKFKAELPELTDALDWLVSEDYIGGYDDSHTESYTGKGYHDRVLITGGLTFKGQDRSTWPD